MSTTPAEPTPIQPPPRLGALIRRNPIALKELRGRMRGARAFVILTGYVTLMSLFTVLLYLIYTTSSSTSLSTSGGVVGKLIFGGVLAVELFLVCFIAPAFTTGAISGERERQTFNLLRTTLLSARRIVVGKLISALAYIVLLLLVAVPLQSLAFLMGGITAAEVLLSVELLLVTGLAYGAVGIYFSARTARTLTASILTYTIALLVTVALPIAALLLGLLTPLGFGNLGNPLLEAILVYLMNLLSATNPIAAAVATETALQRYNAPFFYSYTLVSGQNIPVIDPWVTFTLVYVLATIILVALAVRHVRRLEAV